MKRAILALIALWVSVSVASAVTVVVDYSLDGGYFSTAAPGSDAEKAKLAIEAAAQDLNAALNAESVSLNAVESMAFSGSDPDRTLQATFDWDLKLADPTDPSAGNVTIQNFALASNVFTVFAGRAAMLDSADALGEGAPATGVYSLNYETNGDDVAAIAAIQSAVDYSNGILLRGAGPVITSSDPESPGSQVAFTSGTFKYTVKLGALAGFLTFNSGETWHFDHTTMPGANEYDFYTVMLHEMMHTMGFGTSNTWNSLRANANKDWTGLNAIIANVTGVGLINDVLDAKPDGSHIKNGTMSKTIVGDTAQEAVMTASLAKNQRRFLTKLDIAFLKDLGYGPATAAPTPPPLPTPTPTPTPEATPDPAPPDAPILAGSAKIKTTKPKVKIGGTLLVEGAYVMYKIGSGPYIKAKGGAQWSINLKLKPGKNIVFIVTFDPMTGKMSKPKKITITRAKL
jgi:hypothetical protein